ncbi:carbamoyl-phosphate synthase (glutamine-hydrolyzing) large subunit [Waddlia chondrophila]|uniref:Carbamoyl phosphate synthase small chain n=1 Tax=Waddlia chondrophila (strain ATCC VR-1470 / WSU 86-1044) TaxID=716544 RepID=D6YUA7_WADCW|nr:carbamoyl-phosphate synthase [Waddlia chondrophila WSU 86-1044]
MYLDNIKSQCLNLFQSHTKSAQLRLQNGESFSGRCPLWQKTPVKGEVVFTTGMTGYPESLTDPSYTGQILAFTYPLIGNYGIPSPDQWESKKIHASGVVISQTTSGWSHYEGIHSLLEWLEVQGVGCIMGMDTRALTKNLRAHGSMPGIITSSDKWENPFENPNQKPFVSLAACPDIRTYNKREKTIIAIDCGMKENLLRELSKLPYTIKRVPYNYDFTHDAYDGIFISNGPGDPSQCPEIIPRLKKAMEGNKPIFGICLGAQLMAIAAGATTYKLPFGHRGHNQPCMDLKSGKCYITSQNHGYAIDEHSLPENWEVTFRNLNDQSVEGIAHKSKPFFSVQFHPEAAPGPTDTVWLFQRFHQLIEGKLHVSTEMNTKFESLRSFQRKVMILGSGGLRIGQAGEFDYSGSQAIKALKEEGIQTVLVNPNIATVQTDAEMADQVYLQPLNVSSVKKIIEREKPDGILLSVGGQTALNLGLALEDAGILKDNHIQVLGTPTDSIRLTEDRELFKEALKSIDVKTARSLSVTSVVDALKAAETIGYPLMMRSAYSLGGLGSGVVATPFQLKKRAQEALSQVPQILIEESLFGWKEIEYEIVRDSDDNAITVCNMENFDPMGIHTGESIVVAPSQTLSNKEFHLLREIAIRSARRMNIIGECNIQYALNPKNGDYRVIEMNARLSRSSALASKATGYPLAFVSTKLALGKKLHEIPNSITKKTSAFFEPALDYLVVKIPRWDIQKLKAAERTIGTEMKSVGEVMAIGRSFPEALQKAIRMLNIGADGLFDHPHEIDKPEKEIEHATDRRLFAIARFLQNGGRLEEVKELSRIDSWFLNQIAEMTAMESRLKQDPLTQELLLNAKQMGFSDRAIAKRQSKTPARLRRERIEKGVVPVIKQIDTLAGEFEAETNYLYLTYHGTTHDIQPAKKAPIIVLGSGPYCIGSSVEFDWCAVNTVKTLKNLEEESIIINSNPETVSTDYDESDRLYFEEITLERVSDIADFEKSKGIIVSVGGQIANNLALPLHQEGYPLLGTSAASIDQAENRKLFSSLLNQLGIDQPAWEEVTTFENARAFAKTVGYPVLVRPSYVLSGAAMNTIFSDQELKEYLEQATVICPDHPVVISEFITNAKELELDGVASQGEVVIEAISEHIENAGIHSGDATIVIPPQRLYLETIRQVKKMTKDIVRALNITGPFNIQFIAKDNAIKVIECNLRAARSFPFVSKVTNHHFIEIATQAILGKHTPKHYETLELEYVGVKTPQFSYNRLKGANPVAHVEMASTGEVACLAEDLQKAFYLSWLATEQTINGKRILASIGGDKKGRLFGELKKLEEMGWEIYSTENTHHYLTRHGVASHFLYKGSEDIEPNVITALSEKQVDLIINIPRSTPTGTHNSDGYLIRRLAIDHHIPLITNVHIAKFFLECLTKLDVDQLPTHSWQDFVKNKKILLKN